MFQFFLSGNGYKRVVSTRLKQFLTCFVIGIVPMLMLCLINYWFSARSLETELRENATRETTRIVDHINAALKEREAEMAGLARAHSLGDYLQTLNGAHKSAAEIPDDVRSDITNFFSSAPQSYTAVACLDADQHPVFRAEINAYSSQRVPTNDAAVRFQTKDFLRRDFEFNSQVFAAKEPTLLREGVEQKAYGAMVRYTVPIFLENGAISTPHGALIIDLRLDSMIAEAATGHALSPLDAAQRSDDKANSMPLVIVLDRTGHLIYHTDEALQHQLVQDALPTFGPIAERMIKGESGWQIYHGAARGAGAAPQLVVYRPVPALNATVAVLVDGTAALRRLRLAAWLNVLLSFVVASLVALALTEMLTRSQRSIERVTADALAIADGNLDQHIAVNSSDEMRVLAESFNRMTERLREQMVREAETKQFESFARLSAMMTHDLKNAISSLSLLVNNMEKQFGRAEFRADAMSSLKEATNKLRALVAKLSSPVETLSGEYKLPRPTDLVQLIKQALARTVGATAPWPYEIEMRLPSSLIATIDAERIEKVVENLVLNALEAMNGETGRLTIEAGRIGDSEVFFSVRDTGCGISPEFQRTKLFHPFATTKLHGVGLGLYTCREVVKSHGGRIEVESIQGVGTTFRIVLPSTPEIVRA